MKVTGPGTGGADALPDAAAQPRDPAQAPDASAARFPDDLVAEGQAAPGAEPARPTGEAARTGSATGPGAADSLTEDLAADLHAGKLDARTAVERLVERVVDAQAGPNAPAAVRDRLREALRDTLDNDPFLAEKLRQLL
jgi:hypothetical protein